MSRKSLDELIEHGVDVTGVDPTEGELSEDEPKKEVDPAKAKASKLRKSVRMLIDQGVSDDSIKVVFKHVKNIAEVITKVHESPGRAIFAKKSKSGKYDSIRELMYTILEDGTEPKEAVKMISKEYPSLDVKKNGALKTYKKFLKVWNWAHGVTAEVK